jgi:hypothetical protein
MPATGIVAIEVASRTDHDEALLFLVPAKRHSAGKLNAGTLHLLKTIHPGAVFGATKEINGPVLPARQIYKGEDDNALTASRSP